MLKVYRLGTRHAVRLNHIDLRTFVVTSALENDELTHKEKVLLKKKLKEERRKQHLENRERKAKQIKQPSQSIAEVKFLPDGKKDVRGPLPAAYSPTYVETGWYSWWERSGFFKPRIQEGSKKFVVSLPPPNVTGTLHLGHALGSSIQDALVRWHQMQGHEVLWVPGSDHAGIATQVVVERRLWKEKQLTRHDLGRDQFIQEVWQWKNEKGNVISEQMRRLGCALDWSREYFTLDQNMSTAVREAFIRLHDEGIIYRDKKLVNWSCALCSAISDIEVEDVQLEGRTEHRVPGYEKPVMFGTMTHFYYPVHNSEEKLEVATTRLETMLGDVAVAVHPDDDRYKHLHGRHVLHPVRGDLMPVVCDAAVDMHFGTGVVKITPGHDQTDYDIGKRHSLPVLNVMDDHGYMTNVPQPFMGMKRYHCREALEGFLQENCLLREIKEHAMSIPVCSRSGDIIEPLMKEQWFMDMSEMGKLATDAIKSGELQIIPSNRSAVYNEWFKHMRDWCISRQLWWGHQIPSYRITRADGQKLREDLSEVWFSGHSVDDAICKASEKLNIDGALLHAQQDEDVLDTWFSSALVPFAMLGWPQQTEDMKRYYPTTVLETATDILFFWVARMVMLGRKLTGLLPFNQVLLHGIVRDGKGEKMSKSLGNVIDPLHVINGISLEELKQGVRQGNFDPKEVEISLKQLEKSFPQGIPQCGADALRFTLCNYNYKADNINVDVTHIESHRKFCNKIWQAFKLCNMLWSKHDFKQAMTIHDCRLSGLDAWVASRLSSMVENCDTGFQQLSLNVSTEAIYNFTWLEFCDIYLTAKNLLTRTGESWEGSHDTVKQTLSILHACIDTSLRCLAPFMPHLCEELYQRLSREHSVCLAEYPQPCQYPWRDSGIESQFDLAYNVINTIRSLRTDFMFTKNKADVIFASSSVEDHTALQTFLAESVILSRSSGIILDNQGEADIPGYVTQPINSNSVVHFKIEGNVNKTVLQENFTKKIAILENQYQNFLKSLEDSQEKHHKLTVMKTELDQKRRFLDKIQSLK